jgi:hypothetical protein
VRGATDLYRVSWRVSMARSGPARGTAAISVRSSKRR